MKNTYTLLLALFITTFCSAQKTIDASYLLAKIKKGETVELKNTAINGILDLTFMQDTIHKLSKRDKWWNKGGSNTIEKTINSKITFTNCTFNDHVLAYIPDEDSGYTFIANFTNEVIFKECLFKEKAMFKYSKFKKDTDFSGSIFSDDNTFKYSEFFRNISFKNTLFKGSSTFKYAIFKTFISFENAVFEESGIFKYTKFNKGASFKNVKFNEDLNIKYVEVSGEFDTTNMKVNFSIDSKYADINGRNFNKHILDK